MARLSERLAAYRGVPVLVVGHTGFAGGWLSLWLRALGAEVHGLALAPEDSPSFCEAVALTERVAHALGDIRDRETVRRAVERAQARVVFHLAAQSRVRRSYRIPLETLATNVMGTAHVLDALRAAPSVRACVVVTSDKCYENEEREIGYRETDRLGGADAYSASKACAELVVSCYRRAFLATAVPPVLVASARAGNLIGGGDWADDRILPDCVRAVSSGRPVRLRSPEAVRPWQHVLDALLGYVLLGARLLAGESEFADAWNFGPDARDPRRVKEVVERFLAAWGGAVPEPLLEPDGGPVETSQLRLDPTKAKTRLGWRMLLSFEETVAWSAEWYRSFYERPSEALRVTLDQIARYEDRLD